MRRLGKPHSHFSILLTMVALVTVWACSEDAGTPLTPELDAPVQFSLEDGEVPAGFTPNGVPYRNADYKHATGRSGGASLSARALLNQDGSTDLEVTTGDFDGTPPPNEMTKLQVKQLDDEDEALWTDNQNKVRSGFVASVYDDLPRHARLQVQGNVDVENASGKNRRNGVVTITERVNLRPDLAATSIDGPAEAFVGTAVAFTGYISELNQDLAATADCVFYVNGDAAAISEGLWVGEGDEVTCVMLYPFDEVGTYTVTFAAENVEPGDYDLSNNTTSVTIEIVNPIHQLHGNAWANDQYFQYYYNRQYYVGTTFYSYQTNNRRWSNQAGFYGATPNSLTFPTSLSVTQTSGGVTHDAVNMSSFGGSGTGCRSMYTGKSTISVCTSPTMTSVNVNRNSGYATYYTYNYRRTQSTWQHCHYSSWWGCSWHTHVTYYHTTLAYQNTSNSWGGGYQAMGGSDYTFDVLLEDAAGHTFKSDPVAIALSSYYNYSPSSYGHQLWSGKSGSTIF